MCYLQFLVTGNDIAARTQSPCIWIISPNETVKILEHVIQYKGLGRMARNSISSESISDGSNRKIHFIPNISPDMYCDVDS